MHKTIRICSKGTVFINVSKNWWGCWPSGLSPEVSLTDTGWHGFPAQILGNNTAALSAPTGVPCEHRTSPSGSAAVQGDAGRTGLHPPLFGRRPCPRPWAELPAEAALPAQALTPAHEAQPHSHQPCTTRGLAVKVHLGNPVLLYHMPCSEEF